MKALADELKIADHIYFLGSVKDITGLLSAVDFAVFSSINEGIPNGVLEPMAAGLAVTGTDIPGIRVALGDSMTIWLCPPNDKAFLAENILILAKSSNLRDSIGRLNIERVQKVFSVENMCQLTCNIIVNDLNINNINYTYLTNHVNA